MSVKWDHLVDVAVRLVGAVGSIAFLYLIVVLTWSVKQPMDMLIPALFVGWWALMLRMAWLGTKAKRHSILNEPNLVIISILVGFWFATSAGNDYERRMLQKRADSVAESSQNHSDATLTRRFNFKKAFFKKFF